MFRISPPPAVARPDDADVTGRTAAVVSNWVLRESTGIGRGFDVFDDEFPDQEATRGWPERLAPDTTDAALATLDRG